MELAHHSSHVIVWFDDQINGISEIDPLVEGSPLSFSVFKFSEMLLQHHMLGPNKFSFIWYGFWHERDCGS